MIQVAPPFVVDKIKMLAVLGMDSCPTASHLVTEAQEMSSTRPLPGAQDRVAGGWFCQTTPAHRWYPEETRLVVGILLHSHADFVAQLTASY